MRDAASGAALANQVDVDAIARVGESDAIEELIGAKGFGWHSLNGTPFRESRRDSYALESALILESLLSTGKLDEVPLTHVTWDDEHPLASIFLVHYGALGKEDTGLRQLYVGAAEELHISKADPMPILAGRQAQLAPSAYELFSQRRFRDAGFVVVDTKRLSDLRSYWNHRAGGCRVFPWPSGHSRLVIEAASEWLDGLIAQGLPIWADDKSITIWSDTGIPDELERLLTEKLAPDVRRVLAPLDHLNSIGGEVTPYTTEFGRSFSIDVADDAWQVEVPVPTVDFLPRRPWFSDYGVVAVDVQPSTEWNLPPGRRPAAPNLRMLAPALVEFPNPFQPFIRPTERGLAIGMDLREDAVQVPLISSYRLLETVFGASNVQITTSDSGRRTARIVDLFGGARGDSEANQPAVRRVVIKASNSPFGSKPPMLLQLARDNAGKWPHHMAFRGRDSDYGEQVLRKLTALKMLVPRLKMRCLGCGNTVAYSPEELASDVPCDLCGEGSNLGLALTLKPRPEWVLSGAPSLRSEWIAETLPVMATVSLFSSLEDHGRQLPHYVLGVEFSARDWGCEVDVVVVMETYAQPLIVACESKAHRDEFDDEDIKNLLQVQAFARDAGIDCYLAFSTLRSQLKAAERVLLRDLAEDAPHPVHYRAGMGAAPTLPIILTGRDLSTHSWEDDHLRRVFQTRRSLAEVAIETCKRTIGLSHLQWDDPSSYSGRLRPVWHD